MSIFHSIMLRRYKINDFAMAVYRFQGKKSLVKAKLSFLKKFKDELHTLDCLLFQKLPKGDREVFILWLFRRWIAGGGGVSIPEDYQYIVFKTNMAFLEAEKIYNARKNKEEPCLIEINKKQYFWHVDCELPLKIQTSEDSLRLYPLAHVMLKEYYLDGFNPNDGEAIIDCGGSIGDTALFFNAFYPNSNIYAFECDDRGYEILQKNIESNNKQDKIFPHKNAVGKNDETLYFSNWQVTKEKTQDSKEVSCISIDSFVQKHCIEKVGLIKMDIEGGEQEALKGARETIIKHKPKLMIPIYHLENDIVEIPKILHSFGLQMEFRLKWTEIRVYNVDCILLVRFV